MNRLFALFVFSVIFLLANGCGQELGSGQAQPTEAKRTEINQNEMNQLVITLYYGGEQALDLHEVSETIVFKNDLEKYQVTYLALTNSSTNQTLSLWDKDSLDKISFNQGTLSFEFRLTDDQIGSSAERLKILSLLKTMFQFSEVKKIKIGNQDQDSLSGHINISEPFTREMMADL